MGLMSAVHWWEESQMRVLVLTSLVIQFLLFIFTYLRRWWATRGWIRFLTWLAYLGGDAIAIYALATLFNRHKQDHPQGGGGGSASCSTLEVVWAPILLIHLGGNDGITAYNIEDNELWTRHLLTAVSQVTVAIYVFCKSWPGGDKRLLQAAIVLFVPGVLKCFAKPWDLKRASITSLISTALQRTQKQHKKRRVKVPVRGQGAATCVEDGDNPISPLQRGSGDDIPSTQQGCRRRSTQTKRDALQGKQNEGEMTLEQYVKGAIDSFSEDHGQRLSETILHVEAHKLFVDLPSPYPLRLSILKYFWLRGEAVVCGSVRHVLASAFIFLYTRLKKPANSMGLSSLVWRLVFNRSWILMSRIYLPWAAIGLLHHSHREAYSGIDVKITYALFCCTAVLEYVSLFIWMSRILHMEQQWPQMVAQYNLIGYFVRDKNNSKKVWIASKSGCKDLLDQHLTTGSCFSSDTITELLLQYLRAGWRKKIHDPVSYHKFNDNRGQSALEGHEDELGWSVKGPFDESVLLWHMATDFCCFLKTPPRSSRVQSTSNKVVQCREMSNYMVYLLFVNPEMLLPGTRRNLFNTAYDELKDILGDNKPSLFATAYKDLMDILMDKEQDYYPRVRTAMKELKYIFTDKQRNPFSRSQWKHHAPAKEDELMEKISSILEKSNQASEHGESQKGSEEESRSEDGHIEELEEEGCQQNFVTEAWALAQQLLDLADEEMWKVIQGIWVEMLCFSAIRCRGYLHAKALGSGGEFLSYIWLVRFYMGMETSSERLQREELPNREANNNGAPPPSEAHNGNATTSSTSEVYNRVSPSSENHIIGDELV